MDDARPTSSTLVRARGVPGDEKGSKTESSIDFACSAIMALSFASLTEQSCLSETIFHFSL